MSREAALEARERELEARESELAACELRLHELRRELASEHTAVLQALPHLQAWCALLLRARLEAIAACTRWALSSLAGCAGWPRRARRWLQHCLLAPLLPTQVLHWCSNLVRPRSGMRTAATLLRLRSHRTRRRRGRRWKKKRSWMWWWTRRRWRW